MANAIKNLWVISEAAHRPANVLRVVKDFKRP